MIDLKLDKIIYIGIQLLFLSLIGLGIYILSIPYEAILSYINSFRPEKPYQFFTEEYSSYFKIVVKLFIPLIIVFIIFLSFKKKSCISLIESLLKEIRYYSFRLWENTRSFFQAENKVHITILFSMLLSGVFIRLMYINRSVFHDEAKTFYNFISQSWINTITNYFNPNNHVFHSILSRVFYVLLGNEEWVFRIPVFIFGILTILFIYIFSRKVYNKHIAILLCAISINAIPLVSYSVNARGYSIVTFFSLVLFCIINSLNKKNSLLMWILFVIIASLGIWTIPIMVMPIIFVLVWYFLNTNRSKYLTDLFKLTIVGFSCFLLSTILYTPIILRSKGVELIIGNEYVKSQTYDTILGQLRNYLLRTWEFFNSGYPDIVQITFFFLFIIGIIYHLNHKRHRKFLFSFVILFVFIIFVLRRLPFARTLLFLYPILGVFIASGIFILCRYSANHLKFDLEKIVNRTSLILYMFSTFICIRENGIIEILRSQTCPQAEIIITDLIGNINPNDMIETSTPLAGPITYYIIKNNINMNQLHWHSHGKSKNGLIGKDNIYVITREGRNDIKSFGYNKKSSLEGYTPPKIWKEYQNTVKVYVISRL